MTYAVAAALQSAVFARLSAEPLLAGVPVVDAVPPGAAEGTFVLLGPETATQASDATGRGALHRLSVSVISDAAGFMAAKTAAAAVSAALEEASLSLSAGRLVFLHFERAVARRLEAGTVRRIDMTFNARVEIP